MPAHLHKHCSSKSELPVTKSCQYHARVIVTVAVVCHIEWPEPPNARALAFYCLCNPKICLLALPVADPCLRNFCLDYETN